MAIDDRFTHQQVKPNLFSAGVSLLAPKIKGEALANEFWTSKRSPGVALGTALFSLLACPCFPFILHSPNLLSPSHPLSPSLSLVYPSIPAGVGFTLSAARPAIHSFPTSRLSLPFSDSAILSRPRPSTTLYSKQFIPTTCFSPSPGSHP